MIKSKNFIFYFLFAFLFASECKAQYSFSPSTTLIKFQTLNSLSYDSIHIANSSSDTLYLKWEMIQYDTLGGSYIDFCSSGNCWLGIPVSGSFPAIKPGGFGWAGVHYWTGSIPVTCSAKIYIYKEGSYTTGDTLTYILHAISGTGIVYKDVPENLISVYPNPATDKITIKSTFNTTEEMSVSFCTISGKVIFSNNYKSSLSEIPLNKVNDGIYFLNICLANRKYIKKIVVSR